LPRRVVVTGVGLLTSVGIGTEPVWEAIKSGANGIGPITAFEATHFNSRIAGEVKNFDPAEYIEKKEIKKMGRFIQFAIAASEFALRASGFKVDPENSERTGVYIGSGIGGFEVIEREHKILLEKGPSRMSPFFIPATIINLASGYVYRRFLSAYQVRRRRRDDLRRSGGLHHAAGGGRVRRHARAFPAQ
jgi:3-oxoacyl-[acyl-carrier-protein] synthase II